jgi:hypothetical protein
MLCAGEQAADASSGNCLLLTGLSEHDEVTTASTALTDIESRRRLGGYVRTGSRPRLVAERDPTSESACYRIADLFARY